MKDWIKEHESTFVTIGTAIGLWFAINASFHRDIDKLDIRITALENRVNDMDKRLISIETIMLMQGSPIRGISTEAKNEAN